MTNVRLVWKVSDILQRSVKESYAVIVLNRPIRWVKHDLLLRFWKEARITITVDGGTSRWVTFLKEHGIDVLSGTKSEYIPNLITGDMDSSSPDLVEKLHNLGAEVRKTPDQDHTDYTKALVELERWTKSHNVDLEYVFVIVESSGRFDQTIGNISTLHRSESLIECKKIIQIDNRSLMWVLRPGFHRIIIPEILRQNQTWCGILPCNGMVNHVKTTGFKWNMSDVKSEMDGLVSSSNTYDLANDEVTIDVDKEIVWVMGIEPFTGYSETV